MQLIETEADWAVAQAAPRAVLYKHSTACSLSAGALKEVERFASGNPDVPVFVVSVLAVRDLSFQIAGDLGIMHQSPQAILLSNGEPQWNTSHRGVKAAAIERAICEADYRGNPAELESVCG